MAEPSPDDKVAVFRAFVKQKIALKNRARRVMVFPAGTDLNDFTRQVVVAAAVTRALPGAHVTALFKDAPPWRAFVADCCPHLHSVMATAAEAPMTIPVDWFDVGMAAPVKCPDPQWSDRHLDEPDLVLLPGMLAVDAGRLLALDTPPRLRLPDDGAARATLAGAGLAPDRWFALVELGVDPDPVAAAIEAAGGRALVVGRHIPAPAVPVRAMAARFARFVVGAETALAAGFGTPVLALAGPDGCGDRAWNDHDLATVDPARLPDGVARLAAETAAAPPWRDAAEETAPAAGDGRVTFPFPLAGESRVRVV